VHRHVVVVALALGLIVLTACSSSAKKTVNQVGARAAAEAVRAQLKAADLKDGESVRDMKRLNDAIDQLPGDPTVTGLTDKDKDGKDDDGDVLFTVGRESACLTAHDNGIVDVSNGSC
jgi:hypothetical protein